MSKRVDLIRQKQILQRGNFRVIEARLRHELYDGTMSSEIVRLSFERRDSVAALLHDPTANTVVLVEQFRYPTLAHGSGWIFELPAGSMDTDHEGMHEVTIRRELLEEVGYEVTTLTQLYRFYTSPGASSELIHLFYGTIQASSKVATGGGVKADGEDIRTVIMSVDDAIQKITTGDIMDAKTIIGIQWLKLRSLGH